jgi:hypothetical protein
LCQADFEDGVEAVGIPPLKKQTGCEVSFAARVGLLSGLAIFLVLFLLVPGVALGVAGRLAATALLHLRPRLLRNFTPGLGLGLPLRAGFAAGSLLPPGLLFLGAASLLFALLLGFGTLGTSL